MDCLFLPPGFDPANAEAARLHWVHGAAGGETLALGECAERLGQRPVALVLPAELATSLLVELPTRKARWLRQALPFAVEDMLAEDVEQFHLALGEQVADGRHRVLALRRETLSSWLDALQDAGILPGALYIDADLLPREGVQALRVGERVLLGGEGEARLVFPWEQWPQMSELVPAAQLLAAEDPHALLAAGRSSAVDLAQEEFALQRQDGAWPRWRPFALLALAWVVLQLLFNAGQAWYLQNQARTHAEAARTLYQELFPEDRRIVNLKAQFAEHLSQGSSSGSGLLETLEPVARAIVESKSPLTVLQVDYSRSRGDLAMQVRAADFAVLEQLRQRLSDEGLTVQLGSASREEKGVTARLVLGGGA